MYVSMMMIHPVFPVRKMNIIYLELYSELL
jgi:hypothetical protein